MKILPKKVTCFRCGRKGPESRFVIRNVRPPSNKKINNDILEFYCGHFCSDCDQIIEKCNKRWSIHIEFLRRKAECFDNLIAQREVIEKLERMRRTVDDADFYSVAATREMAIFSMPKDTLGSISYKVHVILGGAFEIGDVVSKIGGTTKMTINRLVDFKTGAECVWFDENGELRREVFRLQDLMAATSEEICDED